VNPSKRSLLVLTVTLLLVTPSIVVPAQSEGAEGNQDNKKTVVATVDGSEITDQQLSQSAQIYPIIMTLSRQYRSFAQFLMTSDSGNKLLTEYREYVLDRLIEQTLQNQKMEELGIEASKEEVQGEIDKIISSNDQFSNEKSLADYLKNNQNTSLADLKARIRNSLRRQQLRNEVIGEISVSEEEVSSYYDSNRQSFTDQEGNVKPLEEVKGQIRENLKTRKSSQMWSNWLEEAKEEAEIEKNTEAL